MRQPDYPAGDHDLLDRVMIDALKAGLLAAEGHRVVNRYAMEGRLPLVQCPVLEKNWPLSPVPRSRAFYPFVATGEVQIRDGLPIYV
ncbi:hypothetical protein [Bradyrhizobium sp. 170]|uniref:hypothetical protein n=1 Tax=Bradyrhizobium sp. 170 TaxID=2782641 RepID=UPI001FFEEDA6|nr:hypothetical protein [Bradyrhizobium sp. 170]UPK06474.1 hypothetical protein IVB05_13700 [Bradyrhizobium sp. 170]